MRSFILFVNYCLLIKKSQNRAENKWRDKGEVNFVTKVTLETFVKYIAQTKSRVTDCIKAQRNTELYIFFTLSLLTGKKHHYSVCKEIERVGLIKVAA